MPQYAAFLREVGADQVIGAGKVKVFVTRTLPLEQIQEALAFKQEGHVGQDRRGHRLTGGVTMGIAAFLWLEACRA